MLKAKQKLVSIFLVCLAMLATLFLSLGALFSAPQFTANAADTEIVFEFGTDNSSKTNEANQDGNDASSYTETVNGYTLTLTSMSKVYKGSYDAKGNACLKLGTGSAAGKFSFTVPDDVTSVIIKVAGYKSNKGKISINNGSTQTISTYSANGAYTDVTVDTSTNKTTSFQTVNGGYRVKITSITFVIPGSSEPECTHENTTLTWEYDAANKQHYQKCECGAEIDGTRAACQVKNEDWSTWASNTDGTHSRTGNCKDCQKPVTETNDCEITTGDYVRNGDRHTQTGTCTVCKNETAVTEDCTLSYENVSNNDKTHNTTSTCSVCKQSVATENVACTFDEGVLDGTTLTFTCKYCKYSYTETATTYTVTYVVPEGIEAPESEEVAEGFTTELPTTGTIDGYTFVGWTPVLLDKATTEIPTTYKAGDLYTVATDITLYALYTYTEESDTPIWKLVESLGDIVENSTVIIATKASNIAMGAQSGNYFTSVSVLKSDDGKQLTEIGDALELTIVNGQTNGTFGFMYDNKYLVAVDNENYLKTESTLTNNSSWTIDISDDGTSTIESPIQNRRLQYNSSSPRFSCYASTQKAVSLYSLSAGTTTFYTTKFAECVHENTTTTEYPATCQEYSKKVTTCDDCHATLETIEDTEYGDHNYVEGVCEVCGTIDHLAFDYSGYYYIAFTRGTGNYLYTKNVWDNKRYIVDDSGLAELPTSITNVDMNYVFKFVRNEDGTYIVYEGIDGDKAAVYDSYDGNVTVVKNKTGAYYLNAADGRYLTLNGDAKYNYVKFYATSNSIKDAYLIPVDLSANIDSASLTIGEDITVNYYVSMSEVFADAKLQYTISEDKTVCETAGEVQSDGRYKFSVGLPPHYMTNNINATLVFNGRVLDSMTEYSIQTYAKNQLKKIENGELADTEGKLKQLLTDMLYYGAAAQNYKGYNTTNLATDSVENIGDPSTAAPETTDFTLVKNEEISSYPAYFKGASVYFDNVNKIVVKINTTKNVTLTINGTEIEVTGTTIYTDAIKATEFGTTYTFVLSCDGVVMQTLTYSVNAYAYAMQNNAEMGELALALYRYGVSAKAYNA